MIDDRRINDFAIRCFRDVADEDYISARLAFRAELVEPMLWASQQALEKYLKCILLLNRIPGAHVKHRLRKALEAIEGSGKIPFELTAPTRNFVEYINDFGPYRYLEISNIAFGRDLSNLDRAVWEFRRYCSESEEHRRVKLVHGVIPPKVRLEGGHLESVIDDDKCPAREPLLWQNAFFGRKPRRWVKRKPWLKAKNSPLYLYPQMLDEILRYIYLPSHIVAGYRAHKQSK